MTETWYDRETLPKVMGILRNHVDSVNARGLKCFWKAVYPDDKIEFVPNPWEEVWIQRIKINGEVFKCKEVANKLLALVEEGNLDTLAKLRGACWGNRPTVIEMTDEGPIFVTENKGEEKNENQLFTNRL